VGALRLMLDEIRAEPGKVTRWIAFAVWVVMPFTLGPLLAEALDPTREIFQTAISWVLWVWWLEVLLTLTFPRPFMLTIIRLGVPAAIPAAVWAAIEVDDNTLVIVGVLAAIIATALVLSSPFADRFIDGASYGDERRFTLRPPGPVLIGLLGPSWVVAIGGLVAGPLFLADERWVLGAILIVIGWPLAFLAARALHQLGNRFMVFVPNGLVVHDLTVMREPVLFQSREIVGLAPAHADTTAEDMTSAALGLALELKLIAPATVPAVTGRTGTEDRDVRAILIAPSRPAAVMRLAQERNFRIV
jgi:hypothetical protein